MSLWIRGAVHRTFKPEDLVSAVNVIVARVTTGVWPSEIPKIFISYVAPPMPRACFQDGSCEVPRN
jgi:hypothetical protein